MSFLNLPRLERSLEDYPWRKWCLAAILILAGLLRFGYLLEQQQNPMPVMVARDPVFDQYNYVTMARDLIQNRWLGSQHPGHSPVYSYLIAVIFSLFGPDQDFVFVFQAILGILMVYVLYRCATVLFMNKNAGLVAAFLAAGYSPFLFYEGALLREAVIAVMNITAFYFLLLALRKNKNKNYILAGIFCGLSLILRAGPYPIVVLGYLLFISWRERPRTWSRAAWFFLGLALMVSPLTIRNYVAGFPALTETSGPTLFWLGNSPDSPGIGLTYTETQKTLTEETQGRIFKTVAVFLREVRKDPAGYAALWRRKVTMLINGYEIPANLSYDLFREKSFLLRIAFLNFSFVSPLAMLGLVWLWRKHPRVEILYLLLIALSLFVLLFHIQGRYRIPFIPFYILAAAYATWGMADMLIKRNYRALAFPGALLALFVWGTAPNQAIMDRYFDGGIRAVDLSNMGSAYLMRVINESVSGEAKTRSLERSLEYFDRALPRLPPAYQKNILITKAMVYRDLRMRVHAIHSLEGALAIDPQDPIAVKEYRRLLAESL